MDTQNKHTQENIPCLSIEQMGALQALKVDTSNATFAWIVDASGANKPFYTLRSETAYFSDINTIVIPAFGLTDILSLLPMKPKWESYSSGCAPIGLGEFAFSIKETCELSLQDHHELSHVMVTAFNLILAGKELLDVAYFVLFQFADKGYINKKG